MHNTQGNICLNFLCKRKKKIVSRPYDKYPDHEASFSHKADYIIPPGFVF